jgi:general L-amino acid transport system substrate-binding protein
MGRFLAYLDPHCLKAFDRGVERGTRAVVRGLPLFLLMYELVMSFPPKSVARHLGNVALACTLLAVPTGVAHANSTLDDVLAKGFVQCGVSEGQPGFSSQNESGDWEGFDVEYCRAIAAAVLGDADAVEFTSLPASQRFDALIDGEIDILSRNSTWTMGREVSLPISFVGVTYYDGQAFMVRQTMGITSALELSNTTICANAGTTTVLNVTDFFDSRGMPFELVTFENVEEVVAAYDSQRCDAYAHDTSGLFAQRLNLVEPDEHIVLPEVISKEPLSPVVRAGDVQWFNVARWVLFAMINAEEMGLNTQNVESFRDTDNPAIARLVGQAGGFGAALGVRPDWAFQVIAQVGNYGEVFERTIGQQSELGIGRGLNELWSEGGLIYAPPIR